jgi:hypothetical protein
MKHQMKGATQAQQGMTLQINLLCPYKLGMYQTSPATQLYMYGKLMISLLATRILSIGHLIQGGFHDTSRLCLTADPGSFSTCSNGYLAQQITTG